MGIESNKKQVLGRGLSSLFSSNSQEELGRSEEHRSLDVQMIVPGAQQPREIFDDQGLQELSLSIAQKGVLQPLLVRSVAGDGGQVRYELIAGERRLRASILAGLTHVPCSILELSDAEALEISLLENIQRENLSCMEEARGYRRLMDEFGYTQEALSEKLGKSRSHIANYLRLLSLSTSVQHLMGEGKLSAGHGKALLSAQDPEALAQIIIKRGLSVRQTEALVRQENITGAKNRAPLKEGSEESALEEQLSELVGLPVRMTLGNVGGSIQFSFRSNLELDHFLQRLTAGYGAYSETKPVS